MGFPPYFCRHGALQRDRQSNVFAAVGRRKLEIGIFVDFKSFLHFNTLHLDSPGFGGLVEQHLERNLISFKSIASCHGKDLVGER